MTSRDRSEGTALAGFILRGLLIPLVIWLGGCAPDFSYRDLSQYERTLLEPYLRDKKLIDRTDKVMNVVEHEMEATPPVLVMIPDVWARGKTERRIHPANKYIDRDLRARGADDVATVIFHESGQALHAFDVATGSYRGSHRDRITIGKNIRRLIKGAVSRDRSWRYSLTTDQIEGYLRRISVPRQKKTHHSSIFTPPLVVFVKYGDTPRLYTKLERYQAKSAEEAQTVVLIEMKKESGGFYKPVDRSGGRINSARDVGIFNAFDAQTLKYRGSGRKRAPLLPERIKMGTSSHLDINKTLEEFIENGSTWER